MTNLSAFLGVCFKCACPFSVVRLVREPSYVIRPTNRAELPCASFSRRAYAGFLSGNLHKKVALQEAVSHM